MSDIFNEYAKIAVEQGLISEAQVGDETNPRFDSLSDDDIRSLYGIKPNGEDEKHILDQAHPESVVVSPAYDKMNGLVENLFERQDIMAWIARKPNDGKHTQERYVKASQDLTMELLKAAFLLDREGQEDLMKLADSCAERLTNFEKEAIAPLAVAGYAAVVAGLTGLAKYLEEYRSKTNVPDKIDRVLEEIDEIATEEFWRVGDEEFPKVHRELKFLVKALKVFKRSAEWVRSINIAFDPSSDSVDEVRSAAHAAYEQKSVSVINHYKRMGDFMLKLIPKYIKKLKLRDQQIGYPEYYWLENLGKVWRFLGSGDIKDIWLELEALLEMIQEEHPLLENQMELIGNIEDEEKTLAAIEEAGQQVEGGMGELETAPGTKPKTEQESLQEFEEELPKAAAAE